MTSGPINLTLGWLGRHTPPRESALTASRQPSSTSLLGRGRLDLSRIGVAASNRAVLVAGGHIAGDKRHTYELLLPPSLRAKAEWHRFTITLAFMAPTVGQLNRYRSAKVYFSTPDLSLAGGDRCSHTRGDSQDRKCPRPWMRSPQAETDAAPSAQRSLRDHGLVPRFGPARRRCNDAPGGGAVRARGWFAAPAGGPGVTVAVGAEVITVRRVGARARVRCRRGRRGVSG